MSVIYFWIRMNSSNDWVRNTFSLVFGHYLRLSSLQIDVLLTTYNMVGSKTEDRKFFKRFRINYVIYDEGHLLKNCNTDRYRNLMKIHVCLIIFQILPRLIMLCIDSNLFFIVKISYHSSILITACIITELSFWLFNAAFTNTQDETLKSYYTSSDNDLNINQIELLRKICDITISLHLSTFKEVIDSLTSYLLETNDWNKLQGERKILITGTPLQNNLVELISLMYFTMTKLFTKYCDDIGQLLQQFQQVCQSF